MINGLTAIRVATQWYQKHLGSAVRVLMITNDRENKRKANEEGISAETGVLDSFFFSSWKVTIFLEPNLCNY